MALVVPNTNSSLKEKVNDVNWIKNKIFLTQLLFTLLQYISHIKCEINIENCHKKKQKYLELQPLRKS